MGFNMKMIICFFVSVYCLIPFGLALEIGSLMDFHFNMAA